MRRFKNLKTGFVECPQNPEVIKQYEKHNDLYEEIKSKRNAKKDEAVEETEN